MQDVESLPAMVAQESNTCKLFDSGDGFGDGGEA
jgi:hypothetical protein